MSAAAPTCTNHREALSREEPCKYSYGDIYKFRQELQQLQLHKDGPQIEKVGWEGIEVANDGILVRTVGLDLYCVPTVSLLICMLVSAVFSHKTASYQYPLHFAVGP